MITTLRYVGSLEGGDLTNGNSYTALQFLQVNNGLRAVVIDNNNIPYLTQMPVDRTDEWVLESVVECAARRFLIGGGPQA